MKYRLFLLLFLVCNVYVLNAQIVANASSGNQYREAYREYSNKCTRIEPGDPIILSMSDTLYQYADKAKTAKGKTIALILKLDYYRSIRDIDSVRHYVTFIQDFAKEKNQKNYYYFVWRRLIYYYISERYYDLALEELSRMPQKATEDNYIQGVIESYRMLSYYYQERGLDTKAIEYMQKSIAMDLENKIDDYNISYKYSEMAMCYARIGDFEHAEEAMNNALSNCKTSNMTSVMLRRFAEIYIIKGDRAKARKYIDTCYSKHFSQERIRNELLFVEEQYSNLIGDYKKALYYNKELEKYQKKSLSDLENEASYLNNLGRFKDANDKLQRISAIKDSLEIVDMENDFNQQAIMIEVSNINAEKTKIELRLKNINLFYTKIALVIALLIIAIFVFISIRYQRLNKKLKVSDNIKNRFLSNLSHEIRTPLNAIVGFSNVLADQAADNEEQKKYAEIVTNNSDYLLRLISNAIDINTATNKGDEEKFDINTLCNSLIDTYRHRISYNVTLNYIACDKNNVGKSNKEKIYKALSCLVDNAVSFTKKGSITVMANYRRANSSMVITVTDTGIGIPADMQEQVFEYFTKVDSNSPGLGLGLYFCRLLADSLGGTLNLDSSYTDGCRMVLTFPF